MPDEFAWIRDCTAAPANFVAGRQKLKRNEVGLVFDRQRAIAWNAECVAAKEILVSAKRGTAKNFGKSLGHVRLAIPVENRNDCITEPRQCIATGLKVMREIMRKLVSQGEAPVIRVDPAVKKSNTMAALS